MSILGINGMLERVYENTLKNSKTTAGSGTDFKEKLSGAKEVTSFKDMLKSKYPRAYYNVMDTSKIDRGLWGRNDYPWDAYFSEPADESVLNWKPSGAEPSMQDSKVQNKINSMAGKLSIVIPPELEEKMKNDPELSKQVMDKVDNFIAKYYRPEANQGFLITFDENGEINNACIACEGGFMVSSSEFAEANKKRREAQYQFYTEQNKRAESMRILEEIALKRNLFTKSINNKNIAKRVLSETYKSNFFYE